jgi:leader peptidase (prepilin peptidase) / N-methyltransferase
MVAASLVRFGPTPRGLVAAFLASVLVVLSSIDIEHRILPNRIVLPSAALLLVAQTAFFPDRTLEWGLSALGAALLLLLPFLVRPGGIGMGDVKLGLVLGAGLGKDVLPALLLGFCAVIPIALVLVARSGRNGLKATVPLGPFLALGALVVLFSG